MKHTELDGWLLVALTIVGLAFAAPTVSAHGPDTNTDDAPPSDGTVVEWADWMASQMTDHMGPGSVEWMESHTGVTLEAMADGVATAEAHDGPGWQGHC